MNYANTNLLGINTSVKFMNFHPSGKSAAYRDGTVQSLKDTIATTTIDASTGLPLGKHPDAAGILQLQPSSQFGVRQALSTRNGDEVLGADSY